VGGSEPDGPSPRCSSPSRSEEQAAASASRVAPPSLICSSCSARSSASSFGTSGADARPDLGGLEVAPEARPEAGQELTDADLDRSVEIIRQRVDKIGVSEPEIRRQEPDQIVVDLAGVFDAQRASSVIGQTAQLEFFDLQGESCPSPPTQQQPCRGRHTALTAEEDARGRPREWYSTARKSACWAPPTKEELLQQVGRRGARGSSPSSLNPPCSPGSVTNATSAAISVPGGVSRATWYYLHASPTTRRTRFRATGATQTRTERARTSIRRGQPASSSTSPTRAK
jgi:hypothetical protein